MELKEASLRGSKTMLFSLIRRIRSLGLYLHCDRPIHMSLANSRPFLLSEIQRLVYNALFQLQRDMADFSVKHGSFRTNYALPIAQDSLLVRMPDLDLEVFLRSTDLVAESFWRLWRDLDATGKLQAYFYAEAQKLGVHPSCVRGTFCLAAAIENAVTQLLFQYNAGDILVLLESGKTGDWESTMRKLEEVIGMILSPS